MFLKSYSKKIYFIFKHLYVFILEDRMVILVTLLSGETVTLKVLPEDNISKVIKRIEDLKGMSLHQQTIHHKGNRLSKGDVLSKIGITSGSILKMKRIKTGFRGLRRNEQNKKGRQL